MAADWNTIQGVDAREISFKIRGLQSAWLI